MKKNQLAMMLEYIETYMDCMFAEWGANNFDVDGRLRVGPDHKKLNSLRKKLNDSCEEGGEV